MKKVIINLMRIMFFDQNKFKLRLIFLLSSMVFLPFLTGCGLQSSFEIDNDLQLEKISIDQKVFYVATINPEKYQLRIFQNPPDPDSLSIKQAHQNNNSLLTFNGIFYTKNFLPTGLIIDDYTKLNSINAEANLTNGIFAIDQNQKPQIFYTKEFIENFENPENDFEFAIQNGPILIFEGENKITSNDQKKASRTAIGFNQQNEIFIIILKQTLLNSDNALSLFDFAETLNSHEAFAKFDFHNIINLDGGASTGIAFKNEYFPEIEKVQNMILTLSRE